VANGVWQGSKDWTGIQDRYFTAVFLPLVGAPPGSLELAIGRFLAQSRWKAKDTEEPVPQIQTALQRSLWRCAFTWSEDYDELKKMNPPLHSLVNFGCWSLIADPLFHGAEMAAQLIPNWGWRLSC